MGGLRLMMMRRLKSKEQLLASYWLTSIRPTLEMSLAFWTMQTTNPFSSMLYDSTVFASWRIFPVADVR